MLLSNVISSGAFVYLLNCTIDLQFSRKAVATQSAPVSPAPITITFLSLAVMKLLQSHHLELAFAR